jgi:hypothetical protein
MSAGGRRPGPRARSWALHGCVRTLACGLGLGLGAAGPASAVDFRIDEWVLEAGTSPGPSAISESYSAGIGATSTRPSGTYSYSPSSHLVEIGVGYERGRTAGNYGLGYTYWLFLEGATGSFSAGAPESASLGYTRLLPELRGGLFYALSSPLRLQLTPFIGYGLEQLQWKDTNVLGSGTASGSGGVLAYGVLVGARYRLSHGLAAGLDVGYGSSTAKHDFTDSIGTTSDLTVTASGPIAHASCAYRF